MNRAQVAYSLGLNIIVQRSKSTLPSTLRRNSNSTRQLIANHSSSSSLSHTRNQRQQFQKSIQNSSFRSSSQYLPNHFLHWRKPHRSLCSSQSLKQPIRRTSLGINISLTNWYKGPPQHRILVKRGSSSWTALLILILAVGFYTYPSSNIKLFADSDQALPQSPIEPLSSSVQTSEFGQSEMPQENQVGRVGHLTPEQEEKLKELWVLTLEVFGVLEKQQNGSADAEATPDISDSKKPKKKRMGMFRRSHNDDADSTKSSKSGVKTPTGLEDDKYGQTKEFHDAIANQSPESLRATFWSMVKHDHPDALLLRFLRARKWDVSKALVMMVSTMRWRAKDVHVDDDVMKNGELELVTDSKGDDAAKRKMGEDFLTQMRMGKSFFHGLDNEGRPMCIVRARLHRQGEQSEESLERYTVFTIETGRMILSPPTDTACVIFDLTGFSMANMDYTPVKFMIKCFEANYPESLGVVLVHKAPWVFQGIWKIIRGWLDPVVASKVNFTNNEQELEAFIPRSNIIKELGGEEDWEYKYIEPSETENAAMKDTVSRDKLALERETTVKEYEAATKEWINGADVKNTRNQIAATLRDGYWILDPYVRAKSYYDRVGLISNGGKINFYPAKVEASKEAIPNGVPKPAETSEADLD